MKILSFFAALLCLSMTATVGFAQHVFQLDDGNGNYLLLAPPPTLSGGRTLTLPNPPATSMAAGFIGVGTASGQIPIWDNSQMIWAAANPNAALNAMLPSQKGNAGRVLFTDGTNTGWTAISAGGAISVFGRTGIVIAQTGDYNFSQISGNVTAAQLPNLQNMNGLLDIAHGGTGQITSNAALNALLPGQIGNANKVLQSDGTNASWATIAAGGITSVFGRTGTVIAQANDYDFSQISGSATASQLPNLQSMNGLLDIAHGGTGQVTANAALNALLPSQTGNANKILQTDGTNTNWITPTPPSVSSVFGRIGAVIGTAGDYDFSLISGSATASQLPNLQNMNGLLDIAHGGTGQVIANAALNALLPNQAGNANKVLQTDGTNTSWISPINSQVSSVFGRTGVINSATGDYSFSQISGSATAGQLPNLQSMNGLLDIAHGGTGQITGNAALNVLLPVQTGNANKVLQTDGTNTSWISPLIPTVSSVFGRTGAVTSAAGDYDFSQISGTASAGQLPNLQNMNGVLDIAHGGSGQITVNAALNALLPSQTGNANKILQTDGTNTSWISPITAPVTSVFGRTGIIISATGDYNFSQIFGSVTASQLPNLQNMNGQLDIAQGGTGQTTANAALNALLPVQSGNANKVLQTDGTNTSWVVLSSAPVSSVFGRTGVVIATIGDYSFLQISGSATAGQLPNLQNMNGLLDIAHGGTGQITANASLNALLPTQTGNANKVLQTDGTNTSWATVASGGVTSVFGRTGAVTATTADYDFSQISGSATASQLPNLQNMNGLLDIVHGGTGQVTANAALNALLPSQAGNTNKVLQTDGTNTSWISPITPPVSSVFGRIGAVTSVTGDYDFTQISGSATASQLPNLQNLNGLVDIAHGGTGQVSANAALNALLPSQSGNANKILQTDGTNTNWITLNTFPVSSVFGRTGAITSVTGDYDFSQISGSATASQLPNLQNMNGLLDIAHGGTGQITANAALNALLPNQAGNANKILQTDGTNTSWISPIIPSVSSVFGRTGTITSAIGDYNFAQVSGSATAGQLPNLQSMNGLLDITRGGTGQVTANAALNALLPNQTSNANKVLQTDGTNTSWISLTPPPVTSVFGRTGVITSATGDYSFSQISGSATAGQLPNLQNMNGQLDIAHGGTGQSTANAALNALLPSQTGNSTKYLQTDGTNTSWVTVTGGSSGGVNYDVTSAQAAATTRTDYLFNVAYSGSGGNAAAAGAVINATASGSGNNGTGLTVTADGANSSANTGIIINAGNNSSTNVSGTGLTVTATASGTGTSKGLDITCSGGSNRVGLLLTDGHLQSKQTTVITAAKLAKAGATATNPTTSGCTDIAGKITMTVQGAGLGAGDQVKVTFNKAYANAPIVMLTAGSLATVLASPYISAITTTDFTIALGSLPSIGDGEVFLYHVIETQ